MKAGCGFLSVCQRVDVSGLPTVWCEIIGGWDCDKVIGDLVQHDKATVDASLISVIAVYGNKEEQHKKILFSENEWRKKNLN